MNAHVDLYRYHRHAWLVYTYVMPWRDYVAMFK